MCLEVSRYVFDRGQSNYLKLIKNTFGYGEAGGSNLKLLKHKQAKIFASFIEILDGLKKFEQKTVYLNILGTKMSNNVRFVEEKHEKAMEQAKLNLSREVKKIREANYYYYKLQLNNDHLPDNVSMGHYESVVLQGILEIGNFIIQFQNMHKEFCQEGENLNLMQDFDKRIKKHDSFQTRIKNRFHDLEFKMGEIIGKSNDYDWDLFIIQKKITRIHQFLHEKSDRTWKVLQGIFRILEIPGSDIVAERFWPIFDFFDETDEDEEHLVFHVCMKGYRSQLASLQSHMKLQHESEKLTNFIEEMVKLKSSVEESFKNVRSEYFRHAVCKREGYAVYG